MEAGIPERIPSNASSGRRSAFHDRQHAAFRSNAQRLDVIMNTVRRHVGDVIDAPDLMKPTVRSGRVAWDERGHAVLDWQTEPGVYSRDVNIHELNVPAKSELCLAEAPVRAGRNFEGLWIHDDR